MVRKKTLRMDVKNSNSSHDVCVSYNYISKFLAAVLKPSCNARHTHTLVNEQSPSSLKEILKRKLSTKPWVVGYEVGAGTARTQGVFVDIKVRLWKRQRHSCTWPLWYSKYWPKDAHFFCYVSLSLSLVPSSLASIHNGTPEVWPRCHVDR